MSAARCARDLWQASSPADAILDRLAHNAHKIALRGESMQKGANRLDTTDQKE